MSENMQQLVVMSLDLPPRVILDELAHIDAAPAAHVRHLMIGAAAARHQTALDQFQTEGQPVSLPEAVTSPLLLGAEGQSVQARERKQRGAQTVRDPLEPGNILIVARYSKK